jgi:hypothetical protein
MSRTQYGNVVGLLVLLLVSGCSDGPLTKLAPATGRVVYKNQAVAAAEIYFNPDAQKGNQGELGSALLAEDGSFSITTHHPKGPRTGVVPGAYKVTLGLGRRPEKDLVKYRTIQATPLAIEIPEEGLSNILIDLDKGTIEVK